MASFDLIHVKISGVGDDGFSKGELRLGFWDDRRQDRLILDIPTYFQADLEASLGDVHESVGTLAADFLREVADLIGTHTVAELVQMAALEKARQDEAAASKITSLAAPPA